MLKSKKLMILGAGIYQLPLIKIAKKLGINVLVVSWKGNYPGLKYADTVYYEDTKNYKNIVKIAKKHDIDGIITTGTDVCTITLGKVNTVLKLNGLKSKSASLVNDKSKMKEKFVDYGVRTAEFKLVNNFTDIKNFLKKHDFPLVLKVVDNSGSRGVFVLKNIAHAKDAYDKIFSMTKKKYLIVEEFIKGKEFGAQAFVLNGKIQFIIPHDDQLFYGDTGVPIGHSAPISLSKKVLFDMEKQIKRSINALKLNNCALNFDFILKNDLCYLLEVGARAGATCLPELVSILYNFDYYKYMIEVSLNKKPTLIIPRNLQPNASSLLFSNLSGTIKKINNKNLKSDEDIIELNMDYNIGEKVNKFNVGPDRIGHVIVKGSSLNNAKTKLKKTLEKIKITVK